MHEHAYLLWKRSMILFLVLLAGVVASDRFSLFLLINDGVGVLGKTFWSAISNLGDGFAAALILLFVAGRRPDMIRAALIATILAIPFTQIPKYVTTVARPGFFFPDTVIGGLPGSWSFPSGHTATAGVIFGVIFLMTRSRPLRIAAFICMIGVGISRIAVGVHWPLDVVFGWIVGLTSAAVGVLLTKPNQTVTFMSSIIPLLLTGAAVKFAFDYDLNPGMPMFQRIFGIAAFAAGVYAVVSLLKEARHGRDEKRS